MTLPDVVTFHKRDSNVLLYLKMRASFPRGTSRWGRFETSDWDHKLFRKLLIEVIHQVRTEVTFTQRGQTSSNHKLSIPGHEKRDHKFEIVLFFPWLWLNLRALRSPFLTISFNLCPFLGGVMHLCEQQSLFFLIKREMMCKGSVWWTEEDRRKVTLVCQGIRCLSVRPWRSL